MRKSVLTRLFALVVLVITSLSVPILAYAKTNDATTSSIPGLPAGVQYNVNSAVDIEYSDNNTASIEKASGVKISSDLVLSAGHEFLDGGSIFSSSSDLFCRNLSIYSNGDNNSDTSTDNSIYATYTQDDQKAPDISIINTDGDSQFNRMPVPTIGQKPSIGDKVYLVNYEPTANLIDRNPNQDANQSSSLKKYSLPAIYSGVILDNNGSDYKILTGIKSYGQGSADDMSRPGASGGPVFNGAGQLVGISVSIIDQKYNVQEISETYNLDSKNIPNTSELQIENVEPVTPTLIDQYTSLINSGQIINSGNYCSNAQAKASNSTNFISSIISSVQQKAGYLINKV